MFMKCVLLIAVFVLVYAMVMTLLYFDAEKRVRHFASMWRKSTFDFGSTR